MNSFENFDTSDSLIGADRQHQPSILAPYLIYYNSAAYNYLVTYKPLKKYG